MFVFITSLLGCGKSPDADYQQVVEKAMNDLETKNAAHESLWGLGSADRWDINQEDGHLIFTFPDKIVTCEAQIIGSFSQKSQTWLWAWDNPSILDSLKATSLRVRQYGQEHGFAKLTEAKWPATEADGWEMAAIASLLGDAQGVYRGPAGASYVFMTFGTPKIEKR